MSAPSSYIWVVDRSDNRLPFSKSVAASSLMVAGLDPEVAYAIAEEVETRLRGSGRTEVGVTDLMAIHREAVAAEAGEERATRYEAWVTGRRRGRPIVLLLGGAPGVGKSTVAGEVGALLRISSVIPTDAVRQVMRNLLPVSLAPLVHVSSFEAHQALKTPLPGDHDPLIVGFQQQAEMVGAGARGLIERAIHEGSDLVVEGVHVVPGMFDDVLDEWRKNAVVCQVVLCVPDAESHRTHFLTRADRSQQRSPDRYLDSFAEVRRLERYVRKAATERGVPIVAMHQLDETIRQVSSMVVDAVISDL